MKKIQILLVFLLLFNKTSYSSEKKYSNTKAQQDVTIKAGLSNDSLRATDFEWKLRLDNTIFAIHYLGYDPDAPQAPRKTLKPIKKPSCWSRLLCFNRPTTRKIAVTSKSPDKL